MIAITEHEKKIIHEKYPKVHIVRTMRQDSKRHHYYMTEDRKPMILLMSLRNDNNETAMAKKGRAQNRNRKKN